MADKVFVINLEEVDKRNITTLSNLPIPDLEKLSTYVLTPKEAINWLQFPDGVSKVHVEDYYFLFKEIGDEEIHVSMGKEDWQEIIVNKELQIHVKADYEGYSIDLYAYNKDMADEDRDWDNEYLGGCCTSYAEIEETKGNMEG